MKTKYYSSIGSIVLFLMTFLINSTVTFAQDSGFVIKGMYYSQTSPSGPVSLGYMFSSGLTCAGASTVTNVVLTPPGKPGLPMAFDVDSFELNKQFVSQIGMDAEYPNGSYSIKTEGVNYTSTMSISLTGNTYPTTPQISNFTAAQNIDPNRDFALTWNTLGLTSNDYIQVSIKGVDISGVILETPPPLAPGALKGNITSFTIPANTLYPGLAFKGELVAAKVVSVITNNNTDGTKTILVSGYVKFLEFPLRTAGTTTNVFAWRKPNFLYFFPEGTIVGTNAQYSTPRTIQNYYLYFQAFDISPTNLVYFTGPAGSGFNNTSNAWYNPPYTGQGWAGYGSPQITLTSPSQITGGIYTVTYKGVNLKFNFDNPLLASKQIFLVPEFVVGSEGILREIKWSYVRSDGAKVPAQDFMRAIAIIVKSTWDENLFENYDLRPGFTNYVVTNSVVYWNDVGSVQIGYRDGSDNNYITVWKTPAGPRPMTIMTTSLSGTVGQPFSEMLNVSGGMYPYNWSIEYGFLPSGLFLNCLIGTIEGTPGESGSYKIKVKVTDATSQTASKDIWINIAQGTFSHRPMFTNMTKIKGMPSVSILTVPDQFYHIEMSADLRNWQKAFFFTADSDKVTVTVPPEVFNMHNKLFFRVGLGHKLYSDVFLVFFANAGTINSVSPYNVSIIYPVSINYTRACLQVDFDPDYANSDQVYFGNPINAATDYMESRMEEDDPGTIGYWSKLYNGVLPPGMLPIIYKGVNMNFNVIHQASSQLVIAAPAFSVNNGLLTQISWNIRNCVNGAQISPPSFLNNGSIGFFDIKTNELYRYCITNRNETNHILLQPITWDLIKRVQFQYEADERSIFVITFDKN